MHAEMIQQAQKYHTQSIPQAVTMMEQMSAVRQREVFDFIDLLCLRDGIGLVDEVTTEQEKVNKRQFGICKGKGDFVIKDDFEMTDEELINL